MTTRLVHNLVRSSIVASLWLERENEGNKGAAGAPGEPMGKRDQNRLLPNERGPVAPEYDRAERKYVPMNSVLTSVSHETVLASSVSTGPYSSGKDSIDQSSFRTSFLSRPERSVP